jgi:hypothetical protein
VRTPIVTVKADAVHPAVVEPRTEEPGVWVFLWVVFGVLSLSVAAFVALFSTNVPVWDDYNFVPAVVGDQPLTRGWLWEQRNEHRIPLAKLILVGACRAVGNDVRAGMAGSVAVLSALAAALVGLARRLPGGARPSDAVFSVLLLNVGHASNLLWCNQLHQVIPTAIGCGLLVLIAWRACWPGPATAVLVGIALVLLPLFGGTGLLYVPALAVWVLAAAWVEARSPRPGAVWRALLVALPAVPGLVLCALYLRGLRPGYHPAPADGIVDGARTAVQFLAGGIGEPAALGWPWSGVATLSLLVLALGSLARAWVTRPSARCQIFGLLAFLAALLTIAAGVGWGRGWAGSLAGFQGRYVTMATPLWCWLVIVFRLHVQPALGGVVANALFAAACVLLWPNTAAGLKHGREAEETARTMTQEIKAGAPPYRIVARFTPFLHPSQDEVARLLPLLRRTSVGPFGSLRNDPPFVEVPLPAKPTELSLARWDAATSTAQITGVDPQLKYVLPSPRHVAGVRIQYSHANAASAPARFRFAWKRPGQPDYLAAQGSSNWELPTGNHLVTTVWIDDDLSEFRIQPDNQRCEFHIDKITLLCLAGG